MNLAAYNQLNSRGVRQRDFSAANNQYAKTHGGAFVPAKPPVSLGVVRRGPIAVVDRPPISNYAAQQRRDVFGGVLGAASGLATVAAGTVAGASLAPVAVGLGLGYGAYKLGEAVGLY